MTITMAVFDILIELALLLDTWVRTHVHSSLSNARGGHITTEYWQVHLTYQSNTVEIRHQDALTST